MTIDEVYEKFFDLVEDICEIETIIQNMDYYQVIFADDQKLNIPSGTELSAEWAEGR